MIKKMFSGLHRMYGAMNAWPNKYPALQDLAGLFENQIKEAGERLGDLMAEHEGIAQAREVLDRWSLGLGPGVLDALAKIVKLPFRLDLILTYALKRWEKNLKGQGKEKEARELKDELREAWRQSFEELLSKVEKTSTSSAQEGCWLVGYVGKGADRHREAHHLHCPRGLRIVFAKSKGKQKVVLVSLRQARRQHCPVGQCCAKFADAGRTTPPADKAAPSQAQEKKEEEARAESASTEAKEETAPASESQPKSFKDLWETCEQHVFPAMSGAAEALATDLEENALAPMRDWGEAQRAEARRLREERERRRLAGESLTIPVPSLFEAFVGMARAFVRFFLG